jgi:2-desacetyl-2-hydroxyethyl bacteriochlorophyllide A dehydrogenase
MGMSGTAVEFRGDGAPHLVRREVADPGPQELLIAPRAVGICATDLEVCDGTMAYFRLGLARYPIVPGHEWVGEVLAAGDEVDGFDPGDLVVGECSVGDGTCELCRRGQYHLCPNRTETGIMNRDGAMAEALVFPARSAFRVPDAVPVEAAALVEPAAVALNAVHAAGVETGDRALVIGAGAIGLLALQAARAVGASRCVVADTSAARLERAEALGADAVVHVADGVEAAGEPELAADAIDTVVEATGHPGGIALALRAVRPAGRIGVVSLYGREEVPADLDLLVTKDITLRGAIGSPHRWVETLELLAAGRVRAEPLITSRYALDEVPGALERLRARDPSELKVIVDPTRKG